MNRNTFLQYLRRSRLLSGQELADIVARLPEGDRATVVARALIDQGLLTRFQARRLLAGKFKRLVLGQYRLLDLLGRGGMGRVFKAVHATMERTVAIKVVSPSLLKDPLALALFRREVRAAAQLHHPHIVTAFDADETKGMHYLVMEYVQGPSLHHLVKEQGPPPLDLTCQLIRQAAQALQYAHEKGMVHRDIKPANLLIAQLAGWGKREGQAGGKKWTLPPVQSPMLKVVDFGLARVRRGERAKWTETILAKTGNVLGTLDYISPEQANNVHSADIRSDLYSLGCTFYYALTGQAPFPNCAPLEKLAKHLMEQPQPVQALRPEVPAAVAEIVQKLMAKDRNQRFQTPAELVQALSPRCGPGSRHEAPAAVGPLPESPAGDRAGGATCPPAALASDDRSTVEFLVDSPAASPAGDASLWEKWQHWTAIVAASVRRRGATRWINPRAFRALQTELVRACRAQANASEGESRHLFQRLEELVKPWLTPESLTQTDLEIHLSLATLCQQAKQDIDTWAGRSPTRTGEGESTLGSFLGRLLKRKDQPEFKEKMRQLYGVEL
jgi:serine/threonine protein kinase